MSRNDHILLTAFVAVLMAIVLIAFSPVADQATLTMRLWAIAESPIIIAIVSTFFAAFAGTWGAQLLAERTANRRALLSEIRATNAALGLVFNITNTYVVAKKQHVYDLVHDYEDQVARRKVSPGGSFRLNLEPTIPPFSPIGELSEVLRSRMTPDTRVMILLTPLVQSITGFAHTAAHRSKWIEEMRAMPDNELSNAKKYAMFFGLPYAPGRVDDRYPKYIQALKVQTDDCIAFSILLGQSLTAYGERVKKSYGEGAPQISIQNLKEGDSLLPDMSAYSNWQRFI
jgi:hypothetical protein